MLELAIIGGGASGLAAAVTAAARARQLRANGDVAQDVRIEVLESDERVGRSILATGNGRCNLSNERIDATLYRNGAFVADALKALERARAANELGIVEPPSSLDGAMPDRSDVAHSDGSSSLDALDSSSGKDSSCDGFILPTDNAAKALFSELGLECVVDGAGRLFPRTRKASSVVDVLRKAMRALGVSECCSCPVRSIELPREDYPRFTLRMEDGSFRRYDALIVAVGGCCSQVLPSSFVHTPSIPKLGPLKTDTKLVKQLDNIRVACGVSVLREGKVVAYEEGELLFRSYGVSGIVVFNLSRFAEEGDELSIDLLPEYGERQDSAWLEERALRLRKLHGNSLSYEQLLCGLLLPQVAQVVLQTADIKPTWKVSADEIPAVARALRCLKVKVLGIGDVRQCQVHRGGLEVAAFDPSTMAAHDCSRLFVAGEALDVDAPCGGYNLHWAWSSGMLAGACAVDSLAKSDCAESVPAMSDAKAANEALPLKGGKA